MAKFFIEPSNNVKPTLAIEKSTAEPIVIEKTVFVESPIQTVTVEVPVIQKEIEIQEKIVYIDRPVEVIKEVTVPVEVIKEVPTTVYKIERVEVPVEKVIKIMDIEGTLEQKAIVQKKNKLINKLYIVISISIILNLMLLLR